MTRPIFEPSTSRTEAKLGFSSDQLFRRPSPVEMGLVDWAVANGESDEIIANDTIHSIPYDSVDIAPGSTCFEAGAATGVGFSTRPIYIIRNGWYMFYLEAWPGGVGHPGNYMVGLQGGGSGYLYNSSHSDGPRRSFYESITPSDFTLGFTETFGPYYVQTRHHLGPTVEFRLGGFVYHSLDTPGNIDWNYGMLAAVFMGPGIGLTGEEDWNPDGLDHDEQFRTYF